MTRYLSRRAGRFESALEQDKLLYWYVQSFLWRYAGSTESIMNQDLHAIESPDGGLRPAHRVPQAAPR